MRIGRALWVGGGLLAVATAPLSAQAEPPPAPPVGIESLPAPEDLPADHRHVTVALSFGEYDPAEIDGSPYPFSFVLVMNTGAFTTTRQVITPGLECDGDFTFSCTVEGPGTFVVSASGPERGPTIGCNLWAQVLSLDGELLARLDSALLDDGYDHAWCIGFPPPPHQPPPHEPPPPSDPPDPELDASLGPVPSPDQTLPETGNGLLLAPWALFLVVLGVLLLLAGGARGVSGGRRPPGR